MHSQVHCNCSFLYPLGFISASKNNLFVFLLHLLADCDIGSRFSVCPSVCLTELTNWYLEG